MKREKIIEMIGEHPCPSCGVKIKNHSESNITYYVHFDNIRICEHLRSNLILDKLISWYVDALKERDAYKKSYEEAVENARDAAWERDLND